MSVVPHVLMHACARSSCALCLVSLCCCRCDVCSAALLSSSCRSQWGRMHAHDATRGGRKGGGSAHREAQREDTHRAQTQRTPATSASVSRLAVHSQQAQEKRCSGVDWDWAAFLHETSIKVLYLCCPSHVGDRGDEEGVGDSVERRCKAKGLLLSLCVRVARCLVQCASTRWCAVLGWVAANRGQSEAQWLRRVAAAAD